MTRTAPAGPAPVQSYPTFWDAVPVDPAPAAPPPHDDAYTLFAHAAEAAGPVTLSVDRLDVG
jgi:hypothetical protein